MIPLSSQLHSLRCNSAISRSTQRACPLASIPTGGHTLSFLTRRTILVIRPRSHRNHKISGRRRADIVYAVLVVGMNKSHRARAHDMAFAIDRELYGTFPHKPHFAWDGGVG